MIQRFINDIRRIIEGRDVRFPDGVFDAYDVSNGGGRIIEATVFGESVDIVDGDFGELSTLCYSKLSRIQEMYDIIDCEFISWLYGYKRESLYLATNFKDIIDIYWSGTNWALVYNEDVLKVCGISLDGVDSFSDFDLFWYIIEKLDVEVLKICDILCGVYGVGLILSNCGFCIEKVDGGYRIYTRADRLLNPSPIFDGEGITVKDSKEMSIMKELYDL